MASTAVLGGLIVAIMLMLYNSITSLIDFFQPKGDSDIVKDEDETPAEKPGETESADRESSEERS